MDAWPSEKILSRLEKQLFPILGSRPFSSLEPADFLSAIQKAESRGAIETAHRLAQLCGQVSRYARIVGHTRYDVAAGLTEALTPVQTNHYVTITDPTEIRHLFRAIDTYAAEPSICFALKTPPLNCAGLNGRIDFELPLGAFSRANEASTHGALGAGNEHLLFPSLYSASRPISDMGRLNALRRMGHAKGVMTIHGFRSIDSTREFASLQSYYGMERVAEAVKKLNQQLPLGDQALHRGSDSRSMRALTNYRRHDSGIPETLFTE